MTATFLVVAAIAALIASGCYVGVYVTVRDQRRFERLRQAERDGIIPPRPLGEVPGWRARNHPAYREHRDERGVATVDGWLIFAIAAGLVLVAPTLRWWTVAAGALVGVVVGVAVAAAKIEEQS